MTSRALIAELAATSQWHSPYIGVKLVLPRRKVRTHFLLYTQVFNRFSIVLSFEARESPLLKNEIGR